MEGGLFWGSSPSGDGTTSSGGEEIDYSADYLQSQSQEHQYQLTNSEASSGDYEKMVREEVERNRKLDEEEYYLNNIGGGSKGSAEGGNYGFLTAEQEEEEEEGHSSTASTLAAPPDLTMPSDFYTSLESNLLSSAPPAFDFSTSQAQKRSELALKRQKEKERKEQGKINHGVDVSNVRSKVNAGLGGKKKASSSSSSSGGGNRPTLDNNLLEQAFQYADRCLAMEALEGLGGDSDVVNAVREENKLGEDGEGGRRGLGVPVGNPLNIAKRMRGGPKQGNIARSGSVGAMGAGGNSRQTNKKKQQNQAGGAYASGSAYAESAYGSSAYGGGDGATRGQKKKKGKRPTNLSSSSGGKGGADSSKTDDMEAIMKNLMSGGEVERLRKELEESKKALAQDSMVIQKAATRFAKGSDSY